MINSCLFTLQGKISTEVPYLSCTVVFWNLYHDKKVYGSVICTLNCYCQLSEISVFKTGRNKRELQHALDIQEAIL